MAASTPLIQAPEGGIDDSERYVNAWGGGRRAGQVGDLVVEEDVRVEGAHHGGLVDAAEEEGVVDAQSPLLEATHGTFVCGGVPGGDQGHP